MVVGGRRVVIGVRGAGGERERKRGGVSARRLGDGKWGRRLVGQRGDGSEE